MKVSVIIAAAGAGRRMKSDRPKQLMTLGEIPILVYTIRKFDRCPLVARIVVASPREAMEEIRTMIAGAAFSKPVSIVQGGARRQDSVAAALQILDADTTIVAVHDAVRPFVDNECIEAVVLEAAASGAAVLAIPIVDTVKQIRRTQVESTLNRERLVLVQTPQAFRIEVLRDAVERARRDEYYGTDESSLVERLGYPVSIVRGSERNIKITRPTDLSLAQFFLQEEQKEQ